MEQFYPSRGGILFVLEVGTWEANQLQMLYVAMDEAHRKP